MKKIIQRLSLVAFVLVVGSVAANAQSLSSRKFDANIPFEFSVGAKTLPAGKYIIRLYGDSNGPGHLEFRNEKLEIVYTGLVPTNAERLSNSAELRFERGAGRAVLAMIVSDRSGHSVPVSHRAKLIAASKNDSETSVKN